MTPAAESTPLIWTTLGNVTVSDLVHTVEWRDTPEQVVFIERYTLAGEVVKESTHVYIRIGATAQLDATL